MKNLMRIMFFVWSVVFNINAAHGEFGDRIELSGQEVFIPAQLGDIKLYKDDDGFHVIKEDEIRDVQNYDCHGVLRNISTEQLRKLLGRDKPKVIIITPEDLEQIDYDIIELSDDEQEAIFDKILRSSGYIAVSQMSNGAYVLREKGRLLGGGTWDTLKRTVRICLTLSGYILVVGAAGFVIGGLGGAIIDSAVGSANVFVAAGSGIGCLAGSGIGYVAGLLAQKNKFRRVLS